MRSLIDFENNSNINRSSIKDSNIKNSDIKYLKKINKWENLIIFLIIISLLIKKSHI